MSKQAFGFIGIGMMGGPMGGRLLAAGHPLQVYDRSATAAASLNGQGATQADSVAQLGDQAETIFLSLPTPQVVEQVCLGTGGLIEGRVVKQVVDLSTVGPRCAAAVASALAERGITYIDCPVSGGVTGAIKGTLAVMYAGPRAMFDTLEPALAIFGKPFYIGDKAGMGQTVKVANNVMSATAVAITSEAVVFGVKAGIDPKIMLDVINAGSGRNTASADKFPRCVLPRTFDVGFAAALAYKDVRLCVDEAEHLGMPMLVGSAVREMLAITLAQIGAEADFSDVVKVCESWAGVEVRG